MLVDMAFIIEDHPCKTGRWCKFEHNGKKYVASMVDLHANAMCPMFGKYHIEVMIFNADDDFNVVSYLDEFCRRNDVLSDEFLLECLTDFVNRKEE